MLHLQQWRQTDGRRLREVADRSDGGEETKVALVETLWPVTSPKMLWPLPLLLSVSVEAG